MSKKAKKRIADLKRELSFSKQEIGWNEATIATLEHENEVLTAQLNVVKMMCGCGYTEQEEEGSRWHRKF
ncbi:MAG: hypothetical protein NC131_11970 [Roseburia sp.]|nr:hypothetical protein [Roseburia sp.]